MFGIGIMELVVLAVVVLLFVGPRRLPQVMHQFGKMFVRLRRMSSEARDTFDQIIRTAEREVDQETVINKAKKLAASSVSSTSSASATSSADDPSAVQEANDAVPKSSNKQTQQDNKPPID